MNKSKYAFTVLAGLFLVVSMAGAESIDPPPLPGEDGDLDTSPDDPEHSDEETTTTDEETGEGDFDPDRVEQGTGVDESGDHGEGGVERTGISGFVHGIISAIAGLIPF